MKQGKQKAKGAIRMNTISKPSVFEVKVNKENKTEVLNKINETRLTKEFFEECAKVAKKLRRNNSNNK